MEIAFWLKGLAGVALGTAIICNLPTRLWLPMERASLQYLAQTSLQTIDEAKKVFKASELWQNNGAVIMVIRRPG
jgi:hypothetical protein